MSHSVLPQSIRMIRTAAAAMLSLVVITSQYQLVIRQVIKPWRILTISCKNVQLC